MEERMVLNLNKFIKMARKFTEQKIQKTKDRSRDG